LQIGASVAGAIGTQRAPVYHSRRGRNLWLFLFAIGVFGCFWVQVKLILFTEAEYLNRDQCVLLSHVRIQRFALICRVRV
jgi:hypothetical protein